MENVLWKYCTDGLFGSLVFVTSICQLNRLYALFRSSGPKFLVVMLSTFSNCLVKVLVVLPKPLGLVTSLVVPFNILTHCHVYAKYKLLNIIYIYTHTKTLN
jgi:hypothetical protein